mmetsp:Transcript_13567/g.22385  ORF Transcript_13567/g.22385 Transcript_13567/m.22385 type:complete len:227 (+) Transcript_13567:824-1504(+)
MHKSCINYLCMGDATFAHLAILGMDSMMTCAQIYRGLGTMSRGRLQSSSREKCTYTSWKRLERIILRSLRKKRRRLSKFRRSSKALPSSKASCDWRSSKSTRSRSKRNAIFCRSDAQAWRLRTMSCNSGSMSFTRNRPLGKNVRPSIHIRKCTQADNRMGKSDGSLTGPCHSHSQFFLLGSTRRLGAQRRTSRARFIARVVLKTLTRLRDTRGGLMGCLIRKTKPP